MPVSWNMDAAERRLRVTVTDPYTFEELAEVARAVFDGGFEPTYKALIDRRQASPPDVEDVQRMAQFLEGRKHRVNGARAAVLVSTVQAYGMHRMFSAYAELRAGFKVEIFEDEAAAEVWLASPGVEI